MFLADGAPGDAINGPKGLRIPWCIAMSWSPPVATIPYVRRAGGVETLRAADDQRSADMW